MLFYIEALILIQKKLILLRLAFSLFDQNANQNQNGNEALRVALARLTLTGKSCCLLRYVPFILILI
jgi:hypothetical protein